MKVGIAKVLRLAIKFSKLWSVDVKENRFDKRFYSCVSIFVLTIGPRSGLHEELLYFVKKGAVIPFLYAPAGPTGRFLHIPGFVAVFQFLKLFKFECRSLRCSKSL